MTVLKDEILDSTTGVLIEVTTKSGSIYRLLRLPEVLDSPGVKHYIRQNGLSSDDILFDWAPVEMAHPRLNRPMRFTFRTPNGKVYTKTTTRVVRYTKSVVSPVDVDNYYHFIEGK